MIGLNESYAHLELPLFKTSFIAAIGFVDSFAKDFGASEEKRKHLKTALEITMQAIAKNSADDIVQNRIGLDVYEEHGNLLIHVTNRGLPVFLSTHGNGNAELFHEAAKHLDKVSWQNHGRDGQTVIMEMRLGEEALKKTFAAISDVTKEIESEHTVVIRELQSGEEGALCQLFYTVYGYGYINDYVYYPEKIKALIDSKKLISIVAALPNGRLIGHVGLLRWNDDPVVYEPCLGVTDPRLKSRGVFSKLFSRTMEWVQDLPMQYCFFDFVTNHDYSQRFVSRYKPVDLALFVGCQSKHTQAKLERLGLGADPKEMDRYSLLYSLIPRVAHPFGKEIHLPNNLGEMLGFLLKPLNLKWLPTPRFQALPHMGEYQTRLEPAQNAVIFDMTASGREAVEKIIKDWQSLLRNGYQYAAVEVAVDQPGIGNLYDVLSEAGFFIAGFVPYHNSRKLGLRFQSIGPTKVAFDEIRVYTETAKKLLDIVKTSYERNGIM